MMEKLFAKKTHVELEKQDQAEKREKEQQARREAKERSLSEGPAKGGIMQRQKSEEPQLPPIVAEEPVAPTRAQSLWGKAAIFKKPEETGPQSLQDFLDAPPPASFGGAASSSTSAQFRSKSTADLGSSSSPLARASSGAGSNKLDRDASLELHDVPAPKYEKGFDLLQSSGMDDAMAHYVSSLFIRDPLVVFKERI